MAEASVSGEMKNLVKVEIEMLSRVSRLLSRKISSALIPFIVYDSHIKIIFALVGGRGNVFSSII
jgi:hypothetical protein